MAADRLEAIISLSNQQFQVAIGQVIASVDSLGPAIEKASQRAEAGLGRVQKNVEAVNFRNLSKDIEKFGADASRALQSIVAPGVAFEGQLRSINTIAHLTETQLAKLGEELRTINRDLGTSLSPVKAAAAEYEILSSGFTKTADASKVLATVAVLSTAGHVEAASAAKLLTGSLNAYGASADEAARFSGILFKSVDLGSSTIAELTQYLGNATPVAAKLGVGFDELNAFIAALTGNGLRTATAIEDLGAAMNDLAKPSAEARKEFERVGVAYNANTIKAEGGLLKFVQRLRASGADLNNIFSDTGLKAINSALQDGGQKVADFSKATANSFGSDKRALEEYAKSAEHQIEVFKTAYEELKIGLSNGVLPLLSEMAKAGTEALRWLDGIPGPTKTAVLGLASLGIALSGILSIASKLKGLGSFISTVGALGGGGAAAAGAAEAAVATGAAAVGTGAAVAGVAEVGVAATASTAAVGGLSAALAAVAAAAASPITIGIVLVGGAVAGVSKIKEYVDALKSDQIVAETEKTAQQIKAGLKADGSAGFATAIVTADEYGHKERRQKELLENDPIKLAEKGRANFATYAKYATKEAEERDKLQEKLAQNRSSQIAKKVEIYSLSPGDADRDKLKQDLQDFKTAEADIVAEIQKSQKKIDVLLKGRDTLSKAKTGTFGNLLKAGAEAFKLDPKAIEENFKAEKADIENFRRKGERGEAGGLSAGEAADKLENLRKKNQAGQRKTLSNEENRAALREIEELRVAQKRSDVEYARTHAAALKQVAEDDRKQREQDILLSKKTTEEKISDFKKLVAETKGKALSKADYLAQTDAIDKGPLSSENKIKAQKVLDATFATSEETRRHNEQITFNLTKELHDKRLDLIKREEDANIRAAEGRRQAEARTQADLERAHSRGASNTEERIASSSRASEESKKILESQAKQKIADIDKDEKLPKAEREALKSTVRKNLKADKANIDADVAQQSKFTRQDARTEDAQRDAERLSGLQRTADMQVSILQQELAAGKDVGSKLAQQIEERLKLKEAELNAIKEATQRATDDPAKILQAERDAQGGIIQARQSANREIRDAIKLLDEQKAKTDALKSKEFGGGILSLSELGKSMSSFDESEARVRELRGGGGSNGTGNLSSFSQLDSNGALQGVAGRISFGEQDLKRTILSPGQVGSTVLNRNSNRIGDDAFASGQQQMTVSTQSKILIQVQDSRTGKDIPASVGEAVTLGGRGSVVAEIANGLSSRGLGGGP